MKNFINLFVFGSVVLGQLSAIPECAQSCFSEAVDYAGCVSDDGTMDPTCACTSYSLENDLGGHDTGISYAWWLCEDNNSCNEKELDQYSTALNDLCYDVGTNAPKYTCGVLPGDPVSAAASITPTGYYTFTMEGGAGTTVLDTVPVYPSVTTTMTTFPVYTSKVVTQAFMHTTSAYISTYELYLAVCPTTIILGEGLQESYPTFIDSYPTTTTENLWHKITAAAAAASTSTAAYAIAQTSTPIKSSSQTSGTSSDQAKATINSSGVNSASRETTTSSSSTSAAAADRFGGGFGVASSLAMAVLGILI